MEASSSYLYPSEDSSLESEDDQEPDMEEFEMPRQKKHKEGKVVTEAMVSIAQQIQALQSMVATAKKRKGSTSDMESPPKKKKKRASKKKLKMSPRALPARDADEDWVAEASSPRRRKFTQKQSLKGISEQQVEYRKVVYKLGQSPRQGNGWVINQFVFVKNYERDNKIYLKCQQKRAFKSCSATAVIHKDSNVAFLRYPHHSHPPPMADEMISGAESPDTEAGGRKKKPVVPKVVKKKKAKKKKAKKKKKKEKKAAKKAAKKAKKKAKKKAEQEDMSDDIELGVEVPLRVLRKGSGWLVGSYVFVRNLESDNRTFLKCQQNKKGCRATAVIDKMTNTAYNRQMSHNHDAPSREEYKNANKNLTVTSDGDSSNPSSLSSLEDDSGMTSSDEEFGRKSPARAGLQPPKPPEDWSDLPSGSTSDSDDSSSKSSSYSSSDDDTSDSSSTSNSSSSQQENEGIDANYCERCDRAFATPSMYRRHMEMGRHKNKKGLYACVECGKEYQFLNGLQSHEALHAMVSRAQVPAESSSSSDSDEESSGSDYPTPSKGRKKASPRSKSSTSKVTPETISWDVLSNQAKYCKKCNQTFTSPSELREHIKLGIHKDSRGWYTCPMCNLQFEFLRTLQVHEELQHKGEKPAAEPENDSSSDEDSLKDWPDSDISDPEGATSTKKPLRSPTSVAKQCRIDFNDTNYCPHCDRTFTTKSMFNKHMMAGRHKNEKGLYACRLCLKEFQYEKALQSHETMHSGPEIFQGAQETLFFRQADRALTEMETKGKGKKRIPSTSSAPTAPRPKPAPKPKAAPIEYERAEFQEITDKNQKRKWLIKDYFYIRNTESAKKIHLRCTKRYTCKATAVIDKELNIALLKNGVHSHPPQSMEEISGGVVSNQSAAAVAVPARTSPEVKDATKTCDPSAPKATNEEVVETSPVDNILDVEVKGKEVVIHTITDVDSPAVILEATAGEKLAQQKKNEKFQMKLQEVTGKEAEDAGKMEHAEKSGTQVETQVVTEVEVPTTEAEQVVETNDLTDKISESAGKDDGKSQGNVESTEGGITGTAKSRQDESSKEQVIKLSIGEFKVPSQKSSEVEKTIQSDKKQEESAKETTTAGPQPAMEVQQTEVVECEEVQMELDLHDFVVDVSSEVVVEKEVEDRREVFEDEETKQARWAEEMKTGMEILLEASETQMAAQVAEKEEAGPENTIKQLDGEVDQKQAQKEEAEDSKMEQVSSDLETKSFSQTSVEDTKKPIVDLKKPIVDSKKPIIDQKTAVELGDIVKKDELGLNHEFKVYGSGEKNQHGTGGVEGTKSEDDDKKAIDTKDEGASQDTEQLIESGQSTSKESVGVQPERDKVDPDLSPHGGTDGNVVTPGDEEGKTCDGNGHCPATGEGTSQSGDQGDTSETPDAPEGQKTTSASEEVDVSAVPSETPEGTSQSTNSEKSFLAVEGSMQCQERSRIELETSLEELGSSDEIIASKRTMCNEHKIESSSDQPMCEEKQGCLGVDPAKKNTKLVTESLLESSVDEMASSSTAIEKSPVVMESVSENRVDSMTSSSSASVMEKSEVVTESLSEKCVGEMSLSSSSSVSENSKLVKESMSESHVDEMSLLSSSSVTENRNLVTEVVPKIQEDKTTLSAKHCDLDMKGIVMSCEDKMSSSLSEGSSDVDSPVSHTKESTEIHQEMSSTLSADQVDERKECVGAKVVKSCADKMSSTLSEGSSDVDSSVCHTKESSEIHQMSSLSADQVDERKECVGAKVVKSCANKMSSTLSEGSSDVDSSVSDTKESSEIHQEMSSLSADQVDERKECDGAKVVKSCADKMSSTLSEGSSDVDGPGSHTKETSEIHQEMSSLSADQVDERKECDGAKVVKSCADKMSSTLSEGSSDVDGPVSHTKETSEIHQEMSSTLSADQVDERKECDGAKVVKSCADKMSSTLSEGSSDVDSPVSHTKESSEIHQEISSTLSADQVDGHKDLNAAEELLLLAKGTSKSQEYAMPSARSEDKPGEMDGKNGDSNGTPSKRVEVVQSSDSPMEVSCEGNEIDTDSRKVSRNVADSLSEAADQEETLEGEASMDVAGKGLSECHMDSVSLPSSNRDVEKQQVEEHTNETSSGNKETPSTETGSEKEQSEAHTKVISESKDHSDHEDAMQTAPPAEVSGDSTDDSNKASYRNKDSSPAEHDADAMTTRSSVEEGIIEKQETGKGQKDKSNGPSASELNEDSMLTSSSTEEGNVESHQDDEGQIAEKDNLNTISSRGRDPPNSEQDADAVLTSSTEDGNVNKQQTDEGQIGEKDNLNTTSSRGKDPSTSEQVADAKLTSSSVEEDNIEKQQTAEEQKDESHSPPTSELNEDAIMTSLSTEERNEEKQKTNEGQKGEQEDSSTVSSRCKDSSINKQDADAMKTSSSTEKPQTSKEQKGEKDDSNTTSSGGKDSPISELKSSSAEGNVEKQLTDGQKDDSNTTSSGSKDPSEQAADAMLTSSTTKEGSVEKQQTDGGQQDESNGLCTSELNKDAMLTSSSTEEGNVEKQKTDEGQKGDKEDSNTVSSGCRDSSTSKQDADAMLTSSTEEGNTDKEQPDERQKDEKDDPNTTSSESKDSSKSSHNEDAMTISSLNQPSDEGQTAESQEKSTSSFSFDQVVDKIVSLSSQIAFEGDEKKVLEDESKATLSGIKGASGHHEGEMLTTSSAENNSETQSVGEKGGRESMMKSSSSEQKINDMRTSADSKISKDEDKEEHEKQRVEEVQRENPTPTFSSTQSPEDATSDAPKAGRGTEKSIEVEKCESGSTKRSPSSTRSPKNVTSDAPIAGRGTDESILTVEKHTGGRKENPKTGSSSLSTQSPKNSTSDDLNVGKETEKSIEVEKQTVGNKEKSKSGSSSSSTQRPKYATSGALKAEKRTEESMRVEKQPVGNKDKPKSGSLSTQRPKYATSDALKAKKRTEENAGVEKQPGGNKERSSSSSASEWSKRQDKPSLHISHDKGRTIVDIASITKRISVTLPAVKDKLEEADSSEDEGPTLFDIDDDSSDSPSSRGGLQIDGAEGTGDNPSAEKSRRSNNENSAMDCNEKHAKQEGKSVVKESAVKSSKADKSSAKQSDKGPESERSKLLEHKKVQEILSKGQEKSPKRITDKIDQVVSSDVTKTSDQDKDVSRESESDDVVVLGTKKASKQGQDGKDIQGERPSDGEHGIEDENTIKLILEKILEQSKAEHSEKMAKGKQDKVEQREEKAKGGVTSSKWKETPVRSKIFVNEETVKGGVTSSKWKETPVGSKIFVNEETVKGGVTSSVGKAIPSGSKTSSNGETVKGGVASSMGKVAPGGSKTSANEETVKKIDTSTKYYRDVSEEVEMSDDDYYDQSVPVMSGDEDVAEDHPETDGDVEKQNPLDKSAKDDGDVDKQKPSDETAKDDGDVDKQKPSDKSTKDDGDADKRKPSDKSAKDDGDVDKRKPSDETAKDDGDVDKLKPSDKSSKDDGDVDKQKPSDKSTKDDGDVDKRKPSDKSSKDDGHVAASDEEVDGEGIDGKDKDVNKGNKKPEKASSVATDKHEEVKEKDKQEMENEKNEKEATDKEEEGKGKQEVTNEWNKKEATDKQGEEKEKDKQEVENEENKKEEKKDSEAWYCDLCDRFFATKGHLDKHNELGRHFCRNADGVYSCRFCKNEFTSIGGVIFHESICPKKKKKPVASSEVGGKSEKSSGKSSGKPPGKSQGKSESKTKANVKKKDTRRSSRKSGENKLNDTVVDEISSDLNTQDNNKEGASLNDEGPDTKKTDKDVGVPQCRYCKNLLFDPSSIKNHEESCKKVSKSLQRVKIHSEAAKKNEDEDQEPYKMVTCKNCKRKVFNKELSQHQEKCQKEVNYCNVCKIHIPTEYTYLAHVEEGHHLDANNKYTCKACELKFTRMQSLKQHVKACKSATFPKVGSKAPTEEGLVKMQTAERQPIRAARQPISTASSEALTDEILTHLETEEGLVKTHPPVRQPIMTAAARRAIAKDRAIAALIKSEEICRAAVDKAAAAKTGSTSASKKKPFPIAISQSPVNWCNVCRRTFTNSRLFDKHMSAGLHQNFNGLYTCECGEEFKFISSLNSHRLEHKELGALQHMPRKLNKIQASPSSRNDPDEAEIAPRQPIQKKRKDDAELAPPQPIQKKRKREEILSSASKRPAPASQKVPAKSPRSDAPSLPGSRSCSPAPSDISSRRSSFSSLDGKSISPPVGGGSGSLYCKACNLMLRNDGVLEKHISYCQPGQKYVKIGCKGCKKDLRSVGAAKSHRVLCKRGAAPIPVEPPDNFCKQCNRLYGDIDSHRKLGIHMNAYGTFECTFCEKVFTEANDLASHKRSDCARAKRATEAYNLLAEAKTKYCQQCDRTFSTISACKAHIVEGRHKNKLGLYACQECGKRFQWEKALVSHEQIEHAAETDAMVEFQHGYGLDEEQEPDVDKHNKRVQAKQVTEAKTALPEEKTTLPAAKNRLPEAKTTLPEAKATLPEAKARLPEAKATLPEAKATLPEAKTKYCQQCDRTFSTVSACQAHLVAGRHKNKHGLYACQECGKGFQYEKALVSHEQIEHPEESDTMVEFQHGYGLDKEQEPEIDTVTKPQESATASTSKDKEEPSPITIHQCQLCDDTFTSKTNLDTHSQFCQGGLKYMSCRFCGKMFTSESLDRHETKECSRKMIVCVSGSKKTQSKSAKTQKTIAVLEFEESMQLVREVISLEDNGDNNSGIICGGDTDVGYVIDKHRWHCSRCDKYYKLSNGYRSHMEVGSHKYGPHLYKNGLFGCLICQKLFSSTSDLLSHKKESHEFCKLCGLCFSDEDAFGDHQTREHSIGIAPSLSCNICGKKYLSKRVLERHVRAHEEMLAVETPTSSDDKRFACDKCPRTFATLDLLQEHSREHGKTNSEFCNQCNMTFYSEKNFIAHMKNGYHKAKNEKGLLVCSGCGKVYFKITQIRDHEPNCMVRHNMSPPVKQKYTPGSETATKDASSGTFRKGEGSEMARKDEGRGTAAPDEGSVTATNDEGSGTSTNDKFTCDKCPRKFPARTDLLSHKDKHASQWYCYRCDYNIAAGMHHSFRQHIESDYHKEHDQKGRMTCDYCGRFFKVIREVKFHEQKCTKKHKLEAEIPEERVPCDGCGKIFRNATLLEHHEPQCRKWQLKHKPEEIEVSSDDDDNNQQESAPQIFFCKTCKENFKDKFEYECHMDAGYHRNKDGNYTCTFCKRPFATMETLTEHEKEHISMALSYSKTNTKTKSWEECFNSFVNNWEASTDKSPAKSARSKAKKTRSTPSPDVEEVVEIPQEVVEISQEVVEIPDDTSSASEKGSPPSTSGRKKKQPLPCPDISEVVEIQESPSTSSAREKRGRELETRKRKCDQLETVGTSGDGLLDDEAVQSFPDDSETSGKKPKQGLRTQKLSMSCQYCGLAFKMRANLLRHERDDHANLSTTTTKSHVTATKSPVPATATKPHVISTKSSSSSKQKLVMVATKSRPKLASPDKNEADNVKYYCVFGCDPPMEHTYPSMQSLWFHAMTDHKDTSNQCLVCNMKFSTWGMANRHLENKHKIESSAAEPEPEPDKELEQEPEPEPVVEPHAESDHDSDPEPYMDLDDSEPELEIDLERIVDSNSEPDEPECEVVGAKYKEEYLCVFGCTYSAFETIDKLAYHIAMKHMNYRSLCSHCNLVFSECAHVLKHVKDFHVVANRKSSKHAGPNRIEEVTDDNYFLCTFGCEMKMFETLSELGIHAKRQHFREKICHLCEICFSNVDEVIKHIGRCHKLKKVKSKQVSVTTPRPPPKLKPKPYQRSPRIVYEQAALPSQHVDSGVLLREMARVASGSQPEVTQVIPPVAQPQQLLLLTPVGQQPQPQPTLQPQPQPQKVKIRKVYICTYGCEDKHFLSLDGLETHAKAHHMHHNKCKECHRVFVNWQGVLKHITVSHFYTLWPEQPMLLPKEPVQSLLPKDPVQPLLPKDPVQSLLPKDPVQPLLPLPKISKNIGRSRNRAPQISENEERPRNVALTPNVFSPQNVGLPWSEAIPTNVLGPQNVARPQNESWVNIPGLSPSDAEKEQSSTIFKPINRKRPASSSPPPTKTSTSTQEKNVSENPTSVHSDGFHVVEQFLCTFGCQTTTFATIADLRSHAQKVHSNEEKCHVCDINIGHYRLVVQHIEAYHMMKVCKPKSHQSPPPIPDSSTSPKQSKDMSASSTAPEVASSSPSEVTTTTQEYRCTFGCDNEAFVSFKSLLCHTRVRHCLRCQLTFDDYEDARLHSESVHKTVLTLPAQDESCIDPFVVIRKLKSHETSGEGDEAGTSHMIDISHEDEVSDDGASDEDCDDGIYVVELFSDDDDEGKSSEGDVEELADSDGEPEDCDKESVDGGKDGSHDNDGKADGKKTPEEVQVVPNKTSASDNAVESQGNETSGSNENDRHKSKTSMKDGLEKETGVEVKAAKVDSKQKSSNDGTCGSPERKTVSSPKTVQDVDKESTKRKRSVDDNDFGNNQSGNNQSVAKRKMSTDENGNRKSLDKNLLAEGVQQGGVASGEAENQTRKILADSDKHASGKMLSAEKSSIGIVKDASGKSNSIKTSVSSLKSLASSKSAMASKSTTGDNGKPAKTVTLKIPSAESKLTTKDSEKPSKGSPPGPKSSKTAKRQSPTFMMDSFFNCSTCGVQFTNNKQKSDHLRTGGCFAKPHSAPKLKTRRKSGGDGFKSSLSPDKARKRRNSGGDAPLSKKASKKHIPSDASLTTNIPGPSQKVAEMGDSIHRPETTKTPPPPPAPLEEPSPVKKLPQASKMSYEEHFLCTFGCEMITFAKFDDLKNHARDSHKGDKKCVPCKTNLVTFNSALEHIRDKHKIWCMVVE